MRPRYFLALQSPQPPAWEVWGGGSFQRPGPPQAPPHPRGSWGLQAVDRQQLLSAAGPEPGATGAERLGPPRHLPCPWDPPRAPDRAQVLPLQRESCGEGGPGRQGLSPESALTLAVAAAVVPLLLREH